MAMLMRLLSKIGLAALIILLGLATALLVGETRGLALADLPETPVNALATTPNSNEMYVSLNNGSWPASVYRSEDNGRTWQAAAPQLNVAITALVVSPLDESVLYAGTAGGSLFKTSSLWSSDDGGKTWRRLVAPLPAGPDGLLPAVTALEIDQAAPHLLYVGTAGHGVYRYDVQRNGYELVGDLTLRDARVDDVKIGASGRIYALTNSGLFVTGDEGWRQLATPPETPLSLTLAPGNPEVLYVSAPSSGAYRSADGGRSWDWIGQNLGLAPGTALRVTALAVDEHNPACVVAATAHGVDEQLAPGAIYKSLDAGLSWTQLARLDNLVTDLKVRDGVAYAATAAGLVSYGQPVQPVLPLLDGLLAPSGIQWLILVLTLGLAALVLVSWEKWFPGRGRPVTAERTRPH